VHLVAGPWVGEFGWELFHWIPHIRFLSHRYDKTIVYCRTGLDLLYQDFAECKHFDVNSYETDACRVDGKFFVLSQYELDKYNDYEYFPNTRIANNQYGMKEYFDYSIYADCVTNPCDVIVHARSTNKCGTGFRNWSLEKWDELVSLLDCKVGFIGLKESSYCPSGAIDLRGNNMKMVISYIVASKLVVGPSSGPMHLASLCKKKHLVWTDIKIEPGLNGTNRDRYETIWNPFKTPVIVVDKYGWQPPVDVIVEQINECIN